MGGTKHPPAFQQEQQRKRKSLVKSIEDLACEYLSPDLEFRYDTKISTISCDGFVAANMDNATASKYGCGGFWDHPFENIIN